MSKEVKLDKGGAKALYAAFNKGAVGPKPSKKTTKKEKKK